MNTEIVNNDFFPTPNGVDIDSIIEAEDILISIMEKNKSNSNEIPNFGELNISVKTACCYINKPYNIKKMCKKLEDMLKKFNTINEDGERKGIGSVIKSINYTKVDSSEEGIIVKNSKANNNFYNSICISVKIREDKCINLMIFTNGRITCTGSKNDDDGYIAANLLLNEMKKMPDIFDNENDIIDAQVINYEVVMINSNFFVGFFVDNHKLYDILIRNRDTYKLFCSFDPRVYQGVKIYFMWNINQSEKNGVCVCSKKKCKFSAKKKNGNGEGDCRRISVAVFGTGKVLIAGAKNDNQLYDTYNYIVKLLQSNYKSIVQQSIEDKKKLLKDVLSPNTIIKRLKIIA